MEPTYKFDIGQIVKIKDGIDLGKKWDEKRRLFDPENNGVFRIRSRYTDRGRPYYNLVPESNGNHSFAVKEYMLEAVE